MLHDIELPEPRLIKRIASGMYDMAESVLFGENECRVQENFHGICRTDEGGTTSSTVSQNNQR